MTEPENFEEDLFADLYNDEDAAAAAAADSGQHYLDDDEEQEQPKAGPESSSGPDTLARDKAADPDQGAPGAGRDYHHEDADLEHDLDNQMNQDHNDVEYDDDDDEVDFNLGRSSVGPAGPAGPAGNQDDSSVSHHTSAGPASAPHRHHHHSKEDGKMFIGGLNWETNDQSLREYFSQYGEVLECTVMRDSGTGRSRGFGFLTFRDPKTVNVVMVKEHFLDGKIIDPKRAIPRDEQEKTSKIFVGGVSQETTDHEFREYFSQFGRVVDATLMMDKDTGRPRGFGFVTFESESGVEACISADLQIHDKPIEVKRAQPRGNMREDEDPARRPKFRKGGGGGQPGPAGGMGANGPIMDDHHQMGPQQGPMAAGQPGGMTPQVMAQYFQRMQQWFAMMQQQQQHQQQQQQVQQQQMAMNRNMAGMNPAMMQQMMQMQQMQQMQQQQQQHHQQQQHMMGRPGPNMMGGAGNMSPAMMQQMQQQQQQQMMQAQAGNGAGFDHHQQQQQLLEQQQYEKNQQNRAAREARQYGQIGYNNMSGGAGAITSWEGMYDDVPQPQPQMMSGAGGGRQGGGGFGRRGGGNGAGAGAGSGSGAGAGSGSGAGSVDGANAPPANAPPANAPTGPKFAGRPGANYRGGGRTGNRFHPYSR